MIRQYSPTVSRCRNIETPRGAMLCGVLPIGTICNVRGRRVIIEAWLPRDYASWNPTARMMTTKRIRGGHIAQIRRLDNGRRFELSDAWLLDADED